MNELSPPPLPASRNEGTSSSAIWSLSLACFVWIALLVLAGVVAVNKPADDDKLMWFIVGASCLILLAALLASIILAVTVLIKRRKGAILSVIALVLSALPFLLFGAAAIRATFKPSSF
jgi:hypothetical protein